MKKKGAILIIAVLFTLCARAQQVPLAQDFTITDTDGNTYNLYEQLESGKKILLFFFNINCGHCHLEAPKVDSVWQQTGSGTGDVIVWGFESSTLEQFTDEDVELFKTETGISFPCFSNENNEPVHEYFEVSYTPQIHIICPDKRRSEISFYEMIESIAFCETNFTNEFLSVFPISVLVNGSTLVIDNQGTQHANIDVYDLNGINLFSENIAPGSSNNSFYIPSKNMYVLRAIYNGKVVCKKLIIP